ncbi:hypothetical protein MASR2M79_19610 [Aminivibrio sp.]
MISVERLSITYKRQSARERGAVKALREVSLSVEKGRSPPWRESREAASSSSWRSRACFRRGRR